MKAAAKPIQLAILGKFANADTVTLDGHANRKTIVKNRNQDVSITATVLKVASFAIAPIIFMGLFANIKPPVLAGPVKRTKLVSYTKIQRTNIAVKTLRAPLTILQYIPFC